MCREANAHTNTDNPKKKRTISSPRRLPFVLPKTAERNFREKGISLTHVCIMIYWIETNPAPTLLLSTSPSSLLSVTEAAFDQMSMLSGRMPFDVIASSNYQRCLPSPYRYDFGYYLVSSPFTLIETLTPGVSLLTASATSVSSPSSILAATTATVATTALLQRGQCQQAHYRYVHTDTH